MQFYEINTCQAMIFRLEAVYKKHEMIKIREKLEKIKLEKNCKYYRKCSNNFAADCI